MSLLSSFFFVRPVFPSSILCPSIWYSVIFVNISVLIALSLILSLTEEFCLCCRVCLFYLLAPMFPSSILKAASMAESSWGPRESITWGTRFLVFIAFAFNIVQVNWYLQVLGDWGPWFYQVAIGTPELWSGAPIAQVGWSLNRSPCWQRARYCQPSDTERQGSGRPRRAYKEAETTFYWKNLLKISWETNFFFPDNHFEYLCQLSQKKLRF